VFFSRSHSNAVAAAVLTAAALGTLGNPCARAEALDADAARTQVARLVATRLEAPLDAVHAEGFDLPQAIAADEHMSLEEDSLATMIGSVTLRARVTKPGSPDRHVALRGRITVRRERLRVARPVPRGQIVSPEDLVADVIWDDGTQQLPLAEDVIGQEARRALAANQPLRATDVGQPTMVKRGQLVKVDYVTRSLSVVGEGKALGDGHLGDVVRVEMPGTSRVLAARVVGSSWVRTSIETSVASNSGNQP